jgi:hypothetical protein
VLAEAAVARERGQPTHELACLQAATQWTAVNGSPRWPPGPVSWPGDRHPAGRNGCRICGSTEPRRR